jgi:hypothetical protein
LWELIAHEFGSFKFQETTFCASPSHISSWLQVLPAKKGVHYEWGLRKRPKQLDIALHFERDWDPASNLRLVELVKSHADSITKDIADSITKDISFYAGPWPKSKVGRAMARFMITYQDCTPEPKVIAKGAQTMKLLIERTWPIIEPHLK